MSQDDIQVVGWIVAAALAIAWVAVLAGKKKKG
jgi:hypothetical protein